MPASASPLEAGEPVGDDDRDRHDVGRRIGADCLFGEGLHATHVRVDRLAVTGRDGQHERDYVARGPARLSRLFAAHIRIIDPHVAREFIHRVALAHDLHQLLLHQPRSVPLDVQLAGQFETRDIVLG